MIKQKTVLEVKAGERIYNLECDPLSPLGEIFDVLTSMRAFVADKIKHSVIEEPKEEEKQPE